MSGLFQCMSCLGSHVMFRCSIRTWALVFLYNVSFGGFLALTVYFPAYYKDAYGKPTEIAGYLGSLFTVIAASYRVPAGFVSDKIRFMNGGVLVEAVSLVEIILGSSIMVLTEDIGWNIAGMIIIAMGIGGGNAATYKILPKFSKASVAGRSHCCPPMAKQRNLRLLRPLAASPQE